MLQPNTFRTGCWLPLSLAALLITAAQAQESPEAQTSADIGASEVLEEVVVRGRRLSEIEADLRIHIHEFLDEVAAPVRTRGYARWQHRVCIGVHNLENTAAQYLIDRISALALEVGLQPGEPGCRPDVNIVFATNAKETASYMVESQPRIFQPAAGNAGMNLGRAALRDFAESDRAVRWWHVSLPVSAQNGAPAIELPQSRLCGASRCPPQVAVSGPSRLHSGIIDAMQYVIIIVDGTKLPGTTWQQIADYLGVVSLAQIDPATNPAAFDSILNLFSNPAAYSGLTDWDRSYLQALYGFDQERVPRAQENDIVSRIAERELPSAR